MPASAGSRAAVWGPEAVGTLQMAQSLPGSLLLTALQRRGHFHGRCAQRLGSVPCAAEAAGRCNHITQKSPSYT